ncbi:MAG TPA: hypothetical protein VF789_22200 [Thermoanaerobaculia bacterium]
MFGTVLDVAIGMVLIYTLLSLMCSTIKEGISSLMAWRAATLRQGLDNLLGDDFARTVFGHHLVQGLVPRNRMPWKKRPSYIPSRTFVLAVLDSLGKENGAGFPQTVEDARKGALKIAEKNPDVGRALLALVDEAEGDFEKLKHNITQWFDSSMQRVSGWYRRKAETVILAIAILVSVVLGIDSIQLGKSLWANPALRTVAIEAAQKTVNNPPSGVSPQGTPPRPVDEVAEDLQSLKSQLDGLEISRAPYSRDQDLLIWLRAHLLGFVITAIAISLGAPFWFDLLNKLVSLRSSGQKPEPETKEVKKT